jgi:outer membrane protein TolC
VVGCTKVGPDFKKQESVKFPKELKHDLNATDDELASWWGMFHDKTLDTLIKKTYENNLDIKQAGLRILQSRTMLGISKGLVYPQSQTLSGSAISSLKNSRTINSVGVNFDVGWELDFWGKYARGIESAEAALYMSVASYRDIMTTVVAEVARNYINYRVAEERIVYAKRNIAIQEKVAKMTQIQFNSGNVSELDMQQARTQLYSTRAKLPAIELSKINSLNAIALLLGISKDEVTIMLRDDFHDSKDNYIKNKNSLVVEIKDTNSSYLGVSIIPEGGFNPKKVIDISLIKRRPDIQLAEYKARMQSAKIGSAEALLYPSFILVGNIGINANDATGSFVSFKDAVGVSAGPSFRWNIFNYGRIRNQIRLQDAIFEESMLNYNKTVLKAINDVSNALNGYVYTKLQLQENEKALKATVRAFNLSARQYNDGLVSYQRLLSTVEKLTITQDIYAQIKGLVSVNEILLYKSLGGGWQHSKGKDYISKETKQRLEKSGVDWGDYLDDVGFRDE